MRRPPFIAPLLDHANLGEAYHDGDMDDYSMPSPMDARRSPIMPLVAVQRMQWIVWPADWTHWEFGACKRETLSRLANLSEYRDASSSWQKASAYQTLGRVYDFSFPLVLQYRLVSSRSDFLVFMADVHESLVIERFVVE